VLIVKNLCIKLGIFGLIGVILNAKFTYARSVLKSINNIKNMNTKEEIEKLKNTKGEIRGYGLKIALKYILKEKGEAGLEKIEKEMETMGYPLKYGEINDLKFYPGWTGKAILIIAKDAFEYFDEDFKKMGKFQAKSSTILNLFMKYFISLDKMLEGLVAIWENSYTEGELRIEKIDMEKKFLTIVIENVEGTPLTCRVTEGFLEALVQMIINKELKDKDKKDSPKRYFGRASAVLNNKVSCKEVKCTDRGDKWHEFLLEW
jgi:hypothetical protein